MGIDAEVTPGYDRGGVVLECLYFLDPEEQTGAARLIYLFNHNASVCYLDRTLGLHQLLKEVGFDFRRVKSGEGLPSLPQVTIETGRGDLIARFEPCREDSHCRVLKFYWA